MKKRLVKQLDIKDCGAACLASILSMHGKKMPISKVKDVVLTDSFGTTMFGLIKGAEKLGFSAKGKKGTRDSLTKGIPLPAIVHVMLEDGLLHYMVLYKVRKKHLVLGDPSKGIIKLKKHDFFKIWTGNIILLQPTTVFETGDERKGSLMRFFELIKPQKRLVGTIFLMSLVLTLIGIITSFYFKFIMDEVIPDGVEKSLHAISIIFAFLYFIQKLLTYLRSHILIYMTRRVDIPLILGYYNHVIDLPMKNHNRMKTGEFVSRFRDASVIKDAISGITVTVMMDSLLITAGGVILFFINSTLFFITLVMAILYAVITIIYIRSYKQKNESLMEKGAEVTSYLVESLRGIEVVKSFNGEREVKLGTEKKYIDTVQSSFKLGTTSNAQNFLKGLVESIGGLIILWVGVSEVLKGNITVGQLLTFNALLVYFLQPLRNVIDLQSGLQTAMVSANRLSEIIDLELETSKEDCVNIDAVEKVISFRNVNFRYGGRRLILKDVCLEIEKGETVAIVGETGSGKTTLVKTLLNLIQPEEGVIEIDGINIQDIDIKKLRSIVGYVPQDTFIFNGTVIENLAFGLDDYEMKKIVDKCKEYYVDELIQSIPGRYSGVIEEGGANLSGGQKQRISIVRAVIKNPSLLIMDEATSNLDSIAESSILKLLRQEKDMTKIIIAHRIGTIVNCDKIVVMEDGRIVNVGTHKDLLNECSTYSNLWNSRYSDLNGDVYE